MSIRLKFLVASCALIVALWAPPAFSILMSYPTSAIDEFGVTGSVTAATGVPDYQFVNDSGLGFDGTNTDVFDVGESAVFPFLTPLRNIANQTDLIVYAFVGGAGATDNAMVQVEVSSDGVAYSVAAIFDTEEARNRLEDTFENNFEAVKKFFIEFGAADAVTHVRITNLGGTAEGLRLDAVEGLHPDVGSSRAFEFRIDRSRIDDWKQFKLRIKNIADPGGVAIREIRINNNPNDPLATVEQNSFFIEGIDGDFICVENCLPICSVNCPPEGDPRIPFSRHAWSIDGIVEAPPGVGLEPGRQAAHPPSFGVDTDSINPYLSGYSFEVTFTDGVVQFIDYDLDVDKEIGSFYEKHLYFSPTPDLSTNRPADFFEIVSAGPNPAVPGLWGLSGWLLLAIAAGVGFVLIPAPHEQA